MIRFLSKKVDFLRNSNFGMIVVSKASRFRDAIAVLTASFLITGSFWKSGEFDHA